LQDALDEVIGTKQIIEEEVHRVLEENTQLARIVASLQSKMRKEDWEEEEERATTSDEVGKRDGRSHSLNRTSRGQSGVYAGDLAFASVTGGGPQCNQHFFQSRPHSLPMKVDSSHQGVVTSSQQEGLKSALKSSV